jgi:riboflavin kinase/FMN adenylyltransferase
LKIIEWNDVVQRRVNLSSPSAATIGVFDGLHRGHEALISRVVSKAPEFLPVAFTFGVNPKKFTKPHRYAGSIFTLQQKILALEGAGIEACVLIDFSSNFSKLAGSEFVSTLVRSFGVRSFVVGSDFKCGHRLSTDAEALKTIAGSLGADAEIVEPLCFEGEIVSSSRIRSAISDGRMDLALAMLGRPYTLDLRGVEIGLDGDDAVVSLRKWGVAEPGHGTYQVTFVFDERRYVGQARYCNNGMLRWPRVQDESSKCPDFIAFGQKIA